MALFESYERRINQITGTVMDIEIRIIKTVIISMTGKNNHIFLFLKSTANLRMCDMMVNGTFKNCNII